MIPRLSLVSSCKFSGGNEAANPGLALLQSMHRLGSFYRSYYNHAAKRIKDLEAAE